MSITTAKVAGLDVEILPVPFQFEGKVWCKVLGEKAHMFGIFVADICDLEEPCRDGVSLIDMVRQQNG